MGKPHAAGWEPEKPTFAQLKEFMSQVDEGKVTKERLQAFLNAKIHEPTLLQAEIAMGTSHFFGPAQWSKYFGDWVKLVEIPDIPWSADFLANSDKDQRTFLFLGVERMAGVPLNLKNWKIALKGFGIELVTPDNFMYDCTCYLRWYLMTRSSVACSTARTFDQMVSELPEEYELASAIERATANILFYLLNRTYLDNGMFVSTSSLGEQINSHIAIGGEQENKLYIREYPDGAPLFTPKIAASLRI